jgi:ribonucleoside-diphosphate reductase alpha chain
LAKARGPFLLWPVSVYREDAPRRNSTVTTIAPTGTISIIAGASSGIEPIFAIAFQHIVKDKHLDRKLSFVNPEFEKVAKARGFWSDSLMAKVAEKGVIRDITEIPEDVRAVFGTAHEIDIDWHVRTQSVFQKHTENAVSKTINLRHDATVDDVKKAYLLAWETNCKGITIFRDGSKSAQVLNLGVGEKAKAEVPVQPQLIQERPLRVEGATYRIVTPLGSAFITVNQDPAGNPFEVFITIGKAGSEVAAMAEALGRMISTTLRFGNHLPPRERAREIVDQLKGIGGGRSVGFGPNKVRSLPDAVAKALSLHFGFGSDEASHKVPLQVETAAAEPEPEKVGDICPSCGSPALVYEEGCAKCHACGHSEC